MTCQISLDIEKNNMSFVEKLPLDSHRKCGKPFLDWDLLTIVSVCFVFRAVVSPSESSVRSLHVPLPLWISSLDGIWLCRSIKRMSFWEWLSTELEPGNHCLLSPESSFTFATFPRYLLTGTKVYVAKVGAAVFEFVLYFLWCWSHGDTSDITKWDAICHSG